MNHSVLYPAGVQAQHIGHLWWLMFWVCTVVFVLVMVFLCAAVFRRRSLVIVGPPAPPDPAQERRLTRNVGTAVGITVVVLFVFLVASFITERRVSALDTPNALTIEVIGHQWWWEIHYTDHDRSEIVQTSNE